MRALGAAVASAVAWTVALAAVLVAAAPPVRAEPGGGGTRAFLGVSTEADLEGLRIVDVVPASPAHVAGLRSGDVIARFDDASPATPSDLVAIVGALPPGRVVTLQVRRQGSVATVRVTLAALSAQAAQSASGLLGLDAPALAVERISGDAAFDPAFLRGRVVLVDFWATWCGPCRRIMPALERLHAALGPRGLVVVGVTDEPASRVRAHLLRAPVSYITARDVGGTARRFGVRAIPTLVVIDRAGRVRQVETGPTTSTLDALRGTLERLLAEPAGSGAPAELPAAGPGRPRPGLARPPLGAPGGVP